MSAFAADLILFVHLAYVGFVIVTWFGILLGVELGSAWIRQPILRRVHLVFAWIPAVEGLIGMVCPLTEWERALRERAGESTEEIGFISRLMRDLLFYEAPPWVFIVSYVVFASLVTLTYVLVRPRPRGTAAADGGPGDSLRS